MVPQRRGAGVAATAPAATSAIGAVTSGGFSFLRGGGTGRAVCEAGALRDALFLSSSHRCAPGGGGGEGGGREDSGLGDEGGRELGEEGQPWALVLVGNDARSWFRPALATLAG